MATHDRGPLPLTPPQNGVWRAQQLDPSRHDHTIGAYLEIRGAADPVLLAEAVRLAVAGTDALRVRFAEEDGTVRQTPAGPPPLRMETADVTGCADPDAESERLMSAELARPTDPGAGDACRFLRVFPVGAARGPAVLRGSALFGAMVTAVGAGALVGAALYAWAGHRMPVVPASGAATRRGSRRHVR